MREESRMQHPLDEDALQNFKEYLRIPSVQPDVNYDECVFFFRRQAAELELPVKVIELATGKPIVIITWLGENPEAPSVMLNSHMDVVPVYPEFWKYPPFSAETDEEGNIFARGAQDTKAAGIQYLEAIRRLKADGKRLIRTVHVTYMPDEEIGGKDGMKKFVHTSEFRALNIGFALDEGLAHPGNIFQIVYGERSIWYVTFHCNGKGGSSDLHFSGTAAEKARIIMDRAMDFRQIQKDKLEANPTLTIGDVNTLNMTMLKGGDGTFGEIPDQLDLTFDVRVAVTQDQDALDAMLQSWCNEAGPGVHFTAKKMKRTEPTKLNESNSWWNAFKSKCDALGMTLQPVICPAAGDCRYLRLIGIPTLGFAPLCETAVRMHDHNEYVNQNVFLRGIEIYCHLIPAVANIPL